MSHPDLIISADSAPDGVLAILARYAAIVDNPQAFLYTATQPLPISLWSNPIKTDAASLGAYLKALGVTAQPIPWWPGAYRAEDWSSPGHTFGFTAGWYYVQEEIAMAAVVALDPQPGECILDLCAAPGGKTTQIATRLQATGTVIANEMHAARLPSLRVNLGRLGLTQVLTTQADGRSLPLPRHRFDRVLVDAPCSGEGNLRRRRPRVWQAAHGNRMATAQTRLLSRALDLVKPGGTVVYSTCTFAPEENEAVLDAALGDRAVVEPFEIVGLQSQPGVTHWQGQDFRADVANAHRYWPHDNNTGGFFVAKLRRTDAAISSPSDAEHGASVPLQSAELAPIRSLLERFGLTSQVLAPYQCWATGKRRCWLSDADTTVLGGVLPQTLGLPLATHTNLGWKPTTAFLQRFGPQLQRNCVTLPDELAARQFLQGRSLNLTAAVDPGYVHVRWGDFELGCGRYRPGYLESQIPKHLRWRELSE